MCNRDFRRAHIQRHEQGDRHQLNLKRRADDVASPSHLPVPVSQRSIRPEVQEQAYTALGQMLKSRAVHTPRSVELRRQHTTSYVNPETNQGFAIDFHSSEFDDFNFEENEVQSFAKDVVSLLENDDQWDCSSQEEDAREDEVSVTSGPESERESGPSFDADNNPVQPMGKLEHYAIFMPCLTQKFIISDISGSEATSQSFRRKNVAEKDTPWYPWPDKGVSSTTVASAVQCHDIICANSDLCHQTCVIDILRHVPRCAFSDRQNTVIHYSMKLLGISNVPSVYTMKNVERVLQRICGVDSIRFAGALGHVYYTNDFAAIIAQVCVFSSCVYKFDVILILSLRKWQTLVSVLICSFFPKMPGRSSIRHGRHAVGYMRCSMKCSLLWSVSHQIVRRNKICTSLSLHC